MDGFRPYTAREALLAIIAECGSEVTDSICRLNAREMARLGLDRDAPENFELTDQLADRLAEAHAILKGIDQEGMTVELHNRLIEALGLPPDLEAMVERRIGSQ